MISDVERRCLIYGLRHLLKDAKNKKIVPAGFNDNYWLIEIRNKNKKQEDGE